jgi:NADH-quinone oxidoreductase subunit C
VTTVLSGHDLASALRHHAPQAVVESSDTAAWITPDSLAEVCAFLRHDSEQRFDLLSAITAVDYVEYFELIYHLTSISRNYSAALKTRCYGRDDPIVPSVTSVWKGAEMQEREVYDLMGIRFAGHPNLRRILLWEGFNGYPLRRDYLEPPLPYTWPHGG